MKEYKGRQLKIRFSSPGTALKIRNLSTWVTNELLEKAFSVSVVLSSPKVDGGIFRLVCSCKKYFFQKL